MAAIQDYTKLPGFERKSFPSFVKAVDEEQGIVTQIVAVMGNRDAGNDIIMPGAFAKCLQERGDRVKVLDQHGTDSVTRIVGRPLSIREIGRDQLPPEVIKKAPTATGGLETVTQYALDTTRGKDVFNLIKGKFLDEASIGYDTIVSENTKEKDGDEEWTARRLKEVRLWEYSPVIWGMNDATFVTGVKQMEVKPYDVFDVEDEFCVFLVDEDGNRTGETLGCHETQAEARAQIAAIEASEGEEEAADDPVDVEAESPEEEKEGRVLSAANRRKLQAAQGELQEALDAIASLLAMSESANDGAEESKAVNLTEHVDRVREAFWDQHGEWYVTEVWDTSVTVTGGAGEYPYYRVMYWMGDGVVEFADMQDWEGGAYTFSPGMHGLQLMARENPAEPETSLTAEAAEPTIPLTDSLRAEALGLLLEIESSEV